MWLSEYLTGKSSGVEMSESGEIRSASSGGVSVRSTRDFQALPVIAPAGIAYGPAVGSQTVVLPSSGGAVCLGVVSAPRDGLEAGELMLYSAGGASIVLKNDGRVLINGRAVT